MIPGPKPRALPFYHPASPPALNFFDATNVSVILVLQLLNQHFPTPTSLCMTNMTTTAVIERICSHPGFVRLCESASVFNPFEVLGLETYELRHTKTLAWLMDPRGSHNLGTAFLERFLKGLPTRVSTALPADLDAALVFSELPVKNKSLRLGDASEPETTEQDTNSRIDVYLQIGARFFLALEAKIGASEHGHQLRNYREAVENQAAKHASGTTALLYLTLDGAAPLDANEATCWTAINWSQHVLLPLRATLDYARQAKAHAEPPCHKVLDFLSDYLRTLQKVTRSTDYAPRVLAEQILSEEGKEAPIMEMMNIFHARKMALKAELKMRLKGMKGGQEAAKLLQEVESDLRARVCETLATHVLQAGWVRLGPEGKAQPISSTKIDFITAKMARLMAKGKPPLRFRLDIRRRDRIELKLFFQGAQHAESRKPMPWLQTELMKWSEKDGWKSLFEKEWNLGHQLDKGGTGQKMAVITFGDKPTAVVTNMPGSDEIKQVQDWLTDVVAFVDRRMDELLGPAAQQQCHLLAA